MNTEPKLLLCIDDDMEDRQWIEEAALEIDPTMVFVNKKNGVEGLSFLQKQKEFNDLPCLIFLDINMPVMDGKQTLAAIKRDPGLQHIPLVVLTTSTSKSDQFYCSQFGVDLISKPFSVQDLKRKVQQVVLSRCA